MVPADIGTRFSHFLQEYGGQMLVHCFICISLITGVVYSVFHFCELTIHDFVHFSYQYLRVCFAVNLNILYGLDINPLSDFGNEHCISQSVTHLLILCIFC